MLAVRVKLLIYVSCFVQCTTTLVKRNERRRCLYCVETLVQGNSANVSAMIDFDFSPLASLLIMGGRFLQILNLFEGLKIGSSQSRGNIDC